MTFQDSQNSLEHRRLLKLAKEYREKGYNVTLHPAPDELPPTLANCSIDMVAVNGDRVVAAEVRTKENLTLNGSEDLRRISESVKQLPGWEFELIITNSRKRSA